MSCLRKDLVLLRYCSSYWFDILGCSICFRVTAHLCFGKQMHWGMKIHILFIPLLDSALVDLLWRLNQPFKSQCISFNFNGSSKTPSSFNLIFVLQRNSKFSLLFHFIITENKLLCQKVLYLFFNQILATLLNDLSLRHVIRSDFISQHKKWSMEQCYCYNLQQMGFTGFDHVPARIYIPVYIPKWYTYFIF